MLPQVQPAVAAMHAQANAAPPKTQRSTLLRSSHNSAFVHCVDAPPQGHYFFASRIFARPLQTTENFSFSKIFTF